MHLPPQLLMSLQSSLDVQAGKFFVSCLHGRTSAELVSEVTVHGVGSDQATAGFATAEAHVPAVPLLIEHWDDTPPPGGDWRDARRTSVSVDTSGSVFLYSVGLEGSVIDAVEFPIARGHYLLEAMTINDGSTAEQWRLRLWAAGTDGLSAADFTALHNFPRGD